MGGKSSEGSSTFQIEGPIDGFLDFEPVEVGEKVGEDEENDGQKV